MIKRTKHTHSLFTLLVLAVTLLLHSSALADTISLNLTSPIQSGAAGSTLSFFATLSTPTANSGAVYFNGDSFNQPNGLTVNDDGFFLGFPFYLDRGQSFSGLLFTVTLGPSLASGQYLGSFTILGGADDAAQNVLSTVNYTVNVGKTPSVVPEPESLMLLATGLPGLALFVRSKRYFIVSSKA